jgi:putative PIN family toxin of toxin-antitoxin system
MVGLSKVRTGNILPLPDEIEPVLNYEQVQKYFKNPQEMIGGFIQAFRRVAIIVDQPDELDIIKEDVTDNRVLECAITSGAAHIVTGDKHLLELKVYEGIVNLPPAGFLTLLELD